jgi:hypothetical protein
MKMLRVKLYPLKDDTEALIAKGAILRGPGRFTFTLSAESRHPS